MSGPSAIPGLILIACVIGAVQDWQYKRNGGKSSSTSDLFVFWGIAGAVVLLLVMLQFTGVKGETIGATSFDLSVLLFALWELRRWSTRRKYPARAQRQ